MFSVETLGSSPEFDRECLPKRSPKIRKQSLAPIFIVVELERQN